MVSKFGVFLIIVGASLAVVAAFFPQFLSFTLAGSDLGLEPIVAGILGVILMFVGGLFKSRPRLR